MKPWRPGSMATMALAAALSIQCAGCLMGNGYVGTTGSWTRDGFDPEQFAADSRACMGEMHAVRASSSMRGAPNWHLHDQCLIRRGYRLEMTPIRAPTGAPTGAPIPPAD